MVFVHFMERTILFIWVLHFKIQCTSKMFLLIFSSSIHEGISLVLSTECCNVLKCSRMNAAGTMMAFSASIFFLLCRFFLLSAQLKLISASLDSTTWPFFVQLGPCMSFQSFTQMHFSSFLWKTSTPCFECFYFTS